MTAMKDAAAALSHWFDTQQRTLPWRHERTPYRVWVSEIILQQTQVVTAAPYFERFIERFPSVGSLAQADLDDVLSAWQGLGYYRRARLLHRAAQQVMTQHDGRLPKTVTELQQLPGIGAYTARAIAAFAYGHRTVAVDGNVRRVGARLLAEPNPRDTDLQDHLDDLLPKHRPERGTEALIELGATVCTVKEPHCHRCPLRHVCRGQDAWWVYPAARKRTPPTSVHHYAQIWLDGDRVWLERRPDDMPLGGQWGPPQSDQPTQGRTVTTVRHAFTHRKLTVDVAIMPDHPPRGRKGRFVNAHEATQLALSSLDRKILAALHDHGLLPWEA